MIGICPKCGDYNWDKEVNGNTIKCASCSETWEFRKIPLFILTGCSGMGKTTTAKELQKITQDYIMLDADIFYNIMPGETEQDCYDQVEQMLSLSKNIAQSGIPVIWTMAGNIDKLPNTYNKRFFSHIYVLALVCEEENLRKRMTEGRKITDTDWIQGSVDYNQYFRTHSRIGEMDFDILETENKSVAEVAKEVLQWVEERRLTERGETQG